MGQHGAVGILAGVEGDRRAARLLPQPDVGARGGHARGLARRALRAAGLRGGGGLSGGRRGRSGSGVGRRAVLGLIPGGQASGVGVDAGDHRVGQRLVGIGAHPGVEVGRPGHEEVDVLAVGGARRHGDVGLRTTENPGGRDDVGLRRTGGQLRLDLGAGFPDGGRANGQGDEDQSEDGHHHAQDTSTHDADLLCSRTRYGRRPAPWSRVSLRALTVRPPRDQNRMTDPATAPTSAQDHNLARAERSDISRNSASRKGLAAPPSSAVISMRTRRKTRRNARRRSDAPEPSTSATIRPPPTRSRTEPHTTNLCAWSHFCGDRPHHTQSLGLPWW